MNKAPLSGIRVLCFEFGIVIPDFSKILGEFGADVIKVESKENLCLMRTIGLGGDINNSPGFNDSNRNKRSFAVNLNKEKGLELVLELVKTADIIGENFRGGVMEKFGMDYAAVQKINPNVIYISSQGFGQEGPYSKYKGYGPSVSATSGVLSLWGHPDDPYPVGGNFPHPDHIASKQAVIAVLAALDYRRRTGKGQFIDLAQTEVAAALAGEYYMDYTINGRIRKQVGNQSPYAAPHGCYPCEGVDQWCAISVTTDEEWEGLCKAMGHPDWTRDQKFKDKKGRLRNADALDGYVGTWTQTHDPYAVMKNLQAQGVPAGILQRAEDTINDPQLKYVGAVQEEDHPVAGKRLYAGIPFRISNMTMPRNRPAPLFGEHTHEICRDILNLAEDEIRQLKEQGVIEDGAS